MDKAQATEIERHLLAIDDALRMASSAIFKLDEEDRQPFVEPLGDLGSCLHFRMLELVYAYYPELRRAGEIPATSSDLLWKDVTLPESVSEADVDAIIFSVLMSRLQKTAMVIGQAMSHCREHGLPVEAEIISARIQALAASNRIESAGDLRQWRHSEVRIKD
jgi:hypothetical protein